jgi:hypothetical protein
MGITFTLKKTKPSNTSLPIVEGKTVVGSKLIASPGLWGGAPAPSLSYEWVSCDSPTSTLLAGCRIIPNQSKNEYIVQMSELGKFIKAKVTAKNLGGIETATSKSTEMIGQIPTSTKMLVINGIQRAGSTVSITNPNWSGLPQPIYTYQWVSCIKPINTQLSNVPDDCVNILNATNFSYLQTRSDTDKFVTVVVRGSNIHGSVLGTAMMKKKVESSPAMILAPEISGVAKVGQVLSFKPGTWEGSPTPTIKYSWSFCDDSVNTSNCKSIDSNVGSTYKVSDKELGKFVRVREIATNIAGTETGHSQPTTAVYSPPTGTGALNLSGLPQVGRTLLSQSKVTWRGFPTPTVTIKWYRCKSPIKTQTATLPNECSLISNTNFSRYVLTDSDSGHYISVAINGSSSSGSAELISPSTISAISMAPKNLSIPKISSSNLVGQLLTVTPGNWIGYPAPTLSYQWESCLSSAGAGCTPIVGANKSTLLLTQSLVGRYIRGVEVGKNVVGERRVLSTSSKQVSR